MKIIKLKARTDIKALQRRLQAMGLWTQVFESAPGQPAQLLVEAHSIPVPTEALRAIEGIDDVWHSASAHPLVDALGPRAEIADLRLDKDSRILIAGPCSVEGEEQIHAAAAMVAGVGASVLRGGCFKPRTGPYSFQGAGHDGLRWLGEAGRAHGLKVVTEALAPDQVEAVAEVADLLQIGARNMQNFALLEAAGRARMPVLLKRGLSATIDEWLQAAEHLLHAGATSVIFCERGIRSFDDQTRFLLDLSAVALLCEAYNLPVIVDPSHACGRKDLIPRLGLAALSCGASGLMIEAHPDPESACSDGAQQLNELELRDAASLWDISPRAAHSPRRPKMRLTV